MHSKITYKKENISHMNQQIIQKLSVITEEEQILLNGNPEIDRQRYMRHESMEVDSGKLLEQGKLIMVRAHTRFAHFPAHTHNYVEVFYACQGSCIHIVDGNRIEVKQGELLFLSPNAVHEILPAGAKDIGINFIILPEFFDTAFRMMGDEDSLLRNFLVGCLCRDTRYDRYLYFHTSGIVPVENLVEILVWSLMDPQNQNQRLNQITAGLLLQYLIRQTDCIESMEQQSEEQRLMIRVLQYIDEHYREGSLTELAQMLGYNLYCLSHMIKKNMGKNYKELLQIRRLKQAAFLLQNTRTSIADVSLAVGYDNTSYFHRIFKAHYGCSPKEYRNRK